MAIIIRIVLVSIISLFTTTAVNAVKIQFFGCGSTKSIRTLGSDDDDHHHDPLSPRTTTTNDYRQYESGRPSVIVQATSKHSIIDNDPLSPGPSPRYFSHTSPSPSPGYTKSGTATRQTTTSIPIDSMTMSLSMSRRSSILMKKHDSLQESGRSNLEWVDNLEILSGPGKSDSVTETQVYTGLDNHIKDRIKKEVFKQTDIESSNVDGTVTNGNGILYSSNNTIQRVGGRKGGSLNQNLDTSNVILTDVFSNVELKNIQEGETFEVIELDNGKLTGDSYENDPKWRFDTDLNIEKQRVLETNTCKIFGTTPKSIEVNQKIPGTNGKTSAAGSTVKVKYDNLEKIYTPLSKSEMTVNPIYSDLSINKSNGHWQAEDKPYLLFSDNQESTSTGEYSEESGFRSVIQTLKHERDTSKSEKTSKIIQLQARNDSRSSSTSIDLSKSIQLMAEMATKSMSAVMMKSPCSDDSTQAGSTTSSGGRSSILSSSDKLDYMRKTSTDYSLSKSMSESGSLKCKKEFVPTNLIIETFQDIVGDYLPTQNSKDQSITLDNLEMIVIPKKWLAKSSLKESDIDNLTTRDKLEIGKKMKQYFLKHLLFYNLKVVSGIRKTYVLNEDLDYNRTDIVSRLRRDMDYNVNNMNMNEEIERVFSDEKIREIYYRKFFNDNKNRYKISGIKALGSVLLNGNSNSNTNSHIKFNIDKLNKDFKSYYTNTIIRKTIRFFEDKEREIVVVYDDQKTLLNAEAQTGKRKSIEVDDDQNYSLPDDVEEVEVVRSLLQNKLKL